jgi:2-polyprenyl-3-methyl-5-hydroxy-6-metoxy-1,4-benzoquinol methylase
LLKLHAPATAEHKTMASWFFKRKTCRLCDSADVERVVPLREIPILTPNVDAKLAMQQHAGVQASTVPLALYRCAGCGHVQLMDVIDPEVQYNNFNYTTTISLGLPEHFRKFAGEVLDAAGTPAGAFVVEVGSNDGTLLRAFKERGMKVLGIDPARRIADKATQSGVRTLATFFTEKLARDIRAEHGAAEIVIANNTFANLDDLTDFAAAVRSLLSPSGVFVFETSYGADVVEKTLIDTIYHEHLSYFMAAPLERYFRKHGMQLIDMQRIWTKGGSIRGTVQLAGGARARNASVDATIADEKRHGFDGRAPFEKMNAAVEALQKEIASLVSSRKAAGKKVAAYGASVGTTTLIQQFGIGKSLEFVADDNPLCEALAGSGYRVPVLRSEAIYERKPDTIIVLAWRYADPIIGKHQRFLSEGGEFVIPLPSVTVRTRAA